MFISPRGRARGSKNCHFQYIKMYKDGKVESLQDSTLKKIRIMSKIFSNKCCSELNFIQKSQWVYMSISLRISYTEPGI